MSTEIFAFMGGTFDPIHNGHLRSALEVQQWLEIDRVWLMPARAPVHRDAPGRSAEARLGMVEAAVQDTPALAADPREILSDQPSYTLYTLRALREQLGQTTPICMIIGMDSLLNLTSWYGWEEFAGLCHILVLKRPGYPFAPQGELADFMAQHQTEDRNALLSAPCGRVLLHEQTPLGISATQIRTLIARGHSPRYLLPDSVWHYIKQHQLYGYTVPTE